MFKKHANYRSKWSTLRNDQSPKIIDGHKDCAIHLAKQNTCNEENGLNGNLKIRILKLETSGKRKRQENKKAEDRKQRDKEQKGKSPFSFERTGASWQVRACVEIIEK
ncbi:MULTISPECIES: hypothetical protein [Vibrio]|uniref:hypothetical protein n=1 Tax=Vibrio TaxID=662 RepID=UPI0018E40254|nr:MULTISPECIES: hypothetical protein [Vibrio]UQV22368.1 hypothetical protein M4S28_05280 [Vibrio sp. J383]